MRVTTSSSIAFIVEKEPLNQKGYLYLFFILILFGGRSLFPERATGQPIVVSSYFNAADPRDEWTELLVIQDNLDIRNWSLGDNNSDQDGWQTPVKFNISPFWQHLRAGTIIVIFHRSVNSLDIPHPLDTDPSDGYVQLAANNINYFNGGSFGSTLNIAEAGDILRIQNSSGEFIHALAHKATPGVSFTALPLPKLNHTESLSSNEAVFVCPGTNIAEYGSNAPQIGTAYTAKNSTPNVSQGLPNSCSASSTSNSNFWRLTRQPQWNSPVLTATPNVSNTQVTLSWNTPATDPYPADNTQGYLILRSAINSFTDPADGTVYAAGASLGSAVVLANLQGSQTTTYVDPLALNCGDTYYYRIYPYRYGPDNNGVANSARGRAYNETQYAAASVAFDDPLPPTSLSVSNNNMCQGALPPTIILSATGGTGNEIQWFTGGCGATYIGSGQSLAIATPSVTTTYYARSASNGACFSDCEDITVVIYPQNFPAVSINASPGNSVCSGTAVTLTATVTNSSNPAFQWFRNGVSAGGNQPAFTFVPSDGDVVYVRMTSVEPCSGSPVNSNTVQFSVSPLLTPSVSISPVSPSVCAGDELTFTAFPQNGGTTPQYIWYLNGAAQSVNQDEFTYLPENEDDVYVVMTSNAGCISTSQATSNTATVSVTGSYQTAVNISASENPACEGRNVTFTATSLTGGSSLTYKWFVNNIEQTETSGIFTYSPQADDAIQAWQYDGAGCAISPGTSNTITMQTTELLVSTVEISASQTAVCPGTEVTVTANPVNGGSMPTYSWFVNTVLSETNNSGVFSFVPEPGDEVYVSLLSSENCLLNNPVVSLPIAFTVSANLTPEVSLAASQLAICAGDPVTFTANAVNGGNVPMFVFHVNGTPFAPQAGNTWQWFPQDGDQIFVRMQGNDPCAIPGDVDSDVITISVSSQLLVSVGLNDPGLVCRGEPALLTAVPVNQGATPVFNWYVNEIIAGVTSLPEFELSTPENGDVVKAELINTAGCATGSPAVSPEIILQVSEPLQPAVSVYPDKEDICEGETVIFTATAAHTGPEPFYQWKLNGVPVGLNLPQFEFVPVDGDVLLVEMTSGLTSCITGNPAQSNEWILQVKTPQAASVSIQPLLADVCAGETAVFTALPVFGGEDPEISWYVNDVLQPTAGDVFSFVPATGDRVYASLISSDRCVTNGSAISETAAVNITAVPEVAVTISSNAGDICNGGEVLFAAVSGFGGSSPQYFWQLNDTDLMGIDSVLLIPVKQGDRVEVSMISSERCAPATPVSASEVVEMKVCDEIFIIPTAFSPDGNGLNDTFKPVTGNLFLDYYQMLVFDRWGGKVFETNDPENGWDGRQKGTLLPSGIYYYRIETISRITGIKKNVKGYFMLTRAANN